MPALAATKAASAVPSLEVEAIVEALEAALADAAQHGDSNETQRAALLSTGGALARALRGAKGDTDALLAACDGARGRLRDVGVAVTDR